MKHNASYNFISQKVFEGNTLHFGANIRIYFEEMKQKRRFFLSSFVVFLSQNIYSSRTSYFILIADLR